MIFTQRQLGELLKLQGKIVLPYRARLSPAAQDWVRHNKVAIGYDDAAFESTARAASTTVSPAQPWLLATQVSKTSPRFVWWSDGPDGVCKAAVGMAAREVKLESMAILEDASRAVSAIRTLSHAVSEGTAAGGVLIVKNAGPALIYANKASGLRAVMATTLAAVEESIATLAANVLVIERDKCSLIQLRNILVRFCRGERNIDPVMQSELDSLGRGCCSGCNEKT
jgi:hypothetical protein